MLRAALWTLRQRRYAALAVTGLVLALVFIGVGSYEIHRFQEKRHDNSALRANAHAATVRLTPALVPLVGQGPAPDANAIRYRNVSITGTYLPGREQYLADQHESGEQGFYVLTPLRTDSGVLLVARGFVAATASGTRPAQIAAAPKGTVTLTGSLQTTQTKDDQAGRLGHGEITSVNPAQQAARLGTPTYQAYLMLDDGQPGASGLASLPEPSLSNPSGGAVEWQLFSYVIQWYFFAVLALLVPFLVSWNEARAARRRFLGVDPDNAEFDLDYLATNQPEALEAGRAALEAGDGEDGVLAVRGGAEVVLREQLAQQRWERAVKLADRYGRSLGPNAGPELVLRSQQATGPSVPEMTGPVVRDSSSELHRSEDAYHGAYNDFLWQLALADGSVPDLSTDPQSGSADQLHGDESRPRPALGELRPHPIQRDAVEPGNEDD